MFERSRRDNFRETEESKELKRYDVRYRISGEYRLVQQHWNHPRLGKPCPSRKTGYFQKDKGNLVRSHQSGRHERYSQQLGGLPLHPQKYCQEASQSYSVQRLRGRIVEARSDLHLCGLPRKY